MKTSFLPLLCLLAVFTFIGCQEENHIRTTVDRPANMTDEQFAAYKAKSELAPQPTENTITNRVPITYVATLSSGVGFPYTHVTANDQGSGSAATHDYFKYTSTAGNYANVTVRRVSCDMDPAFWFHTGEFADTDLLTFEAFADDELPPACPGPWDDPTFNHYANGGTYTIGVASYASSNTPPYDYIITLTRYIGIGGCNSTVPDGVHNATTSMQEAINNCLANSGSSAAFVSCVTALTNTWVSQGKITRAQKSKIVTCAQNYPF